MHQCTKQCVCVSRVVPVSEKPTHITRHYCATVHTDTAQCNASACATTCECAYANEYVYACVCCATFMTVNDIRIYAAATCRAADVNAPVHEYVSLFTKWSAINKTQQDNTDTRRRDADVVTDACIIDSCICDMRMFAIFFVSLSRKCCGTCLGRNIHCNGHAAFNAFCLYTLCKSSAIVKLTYIFWEWVWLRKWCW